MNNNNFDSNFNGNNNNNNNNNNKNNNNSCNSGIYFHYEIEDRVPELINSD